MLDVDLATLYDVETFNLNKAVKRNLNRFPPDFTFQFTLEEALPLKFHFGISKNSGRGGSRTLPYVFTQEGIAVLSSVLKSKEVVEVNITYLMRSLRDWISPSLPMS